MSSHPPGFFSPAGQAGPAGCPVMLTGICRGHEGPNPSVPPRVPPRGLRYLLDSQGTSVFVPLDQRDRGLCLDRAADVSMYPDGNIDDRGHVHHAGRIWESSSTTSAWGKSPSLPHHLASEDLHCFYNEFQTQTSPWLPQAVISRLATHKSAVIPGISGRLYSCPGCSYLGLIKSCI